MMKRYAAVTDLTPRAAAEAVGGHGPRERFRRGAADPETSGSDHAGDLPKERQLEQEPVLGVAYLMTPAPELSMCPLVAHCHLGLARVSRRTGNPEQSLEHIATATPMYREMGMTYWLLA